MNNILIFSDLHISQDSLKECELILNEIIFLCGKFKIDTVIDLGDTFDHLKPSASELDLFSKFIKQLNSKQLIIISAESHESESSTESILNHFEILSDNVYVVKEFKSENNLYCGHFIIKEAIKNYGATISKQDLRQYKKVYLGHQHSFQVIDNICQLGSVRWVDFAEAKDKQKVVAIISDYNTPQERPGFQELKTPVKMIDFEVNSNHINDLDKNSLKNTPLEAPESKILTPTSRSNKGSFKYKSSISQGGNPSNLTQIEALCQNLDKLDKNTKVKVKIQDLKSLMEFLPFEDKYKKKFVKFVRENDFELISDLALQTAKKEISLEEAFEEFAKEKNIDSKIKEVLMKEIKNVS